MKKISKIIAKASLRAAEKAMNKSSDWILFQTKEPKNLRKMLRK
ncbi:MAG: cyclic lactone autoinducer peptide [Bacilli bacterium]|nr:cyclic lactone autoinducer peptide [Bacilli bacterium]